MTHSNLLRVISYLGLRASRKIIASNSIAVSPNPNWCQSTRNRNSPLLILARRGACYSMGQTSSSVSGADADSANANGCQKPELVEVSDAVVVSSEQALTSELDTKLETALVSEGKQGSIPEGKEGSISEGSIPEDVKKESDDEAQKALKLALDELGEPPERPLPGDCCGQGCDVCVWDTYNDELRDYLARRKALLKKSK